MLAHRTASSDGAAGQRPGGGLAASPEPLGREDLGRLAAILQRESGLHVDERKADFLVARLSPRLEALGVTSFAAYAAYLDAPEGMAERRHFVESLTTHTTEFFREKAQYDWLERDGIPDLWQAGAGRSRDLTVWSAACSTGQELYSALMLLDALSRRGLRGLRYGGIGTDVSRSVVARAAQGLYRADEIGGIPVSMRVASLLTGRSDPTLVRIRPELRQRAAWRYANLCHRGDLDGIACDVVFLRNVLIYFDTEMRGRILRNVIEHLRPGGVLLTGHSEPIDAGEYRLEAVRPSIYRMRG